MRLAAAERGSVGRDASPLARGASTTGASLWQKVVGVIGLVVLLWVGGDLFEVVTSGSADSGDPGGSRPGGHAPPAGPAGDVRPAPSGGGGDHRPPPGTPRH